MTSSHAFASAVPLPGNPSLHKAFWKFPITPEASTPELSPLMPSLTWNLQLHFAYTSIRALSHYPIVL